MGLIDKLIDTRDKATEILNPSSIDAFKGMLAKRGGLAPGNKFMVIMSPPQKTREGTSLLGGLINIDLQSLATNALSGNFNLKSFINDPRDIGLLCDSCILPARAFETAAYAQGGTGGSTRQYIINSSFTPVSFTFHLTQDYYVRKMFESWMGMCLNTGNRKQPYPHSYRKDVVIQQLSDQNVPIFGVKLLNAFPTSFEPVVLSNENTATQKFIVNMAYDSFVPQNGLGSAITGANKYAKHLKKGKKILDFFRS